VLLERAKEQYMAMRIRKRSGEYHKSQASLRRLHRLYVRSLRADNEQAYEAARAARKALEDALGIVLAKVPKKLAAALMAAFYACTHDTIVNKRGSLDDIIKAAKRARRPAAAVDEGDESEEEKEGAGEDEGARAGAGAGAGVRTASRRRRRAPSAEDDE
jgi:hypothetical protein